MERMTISAEKRVEVGKGAARSLRRKDMIPGVIYRGGDSQPIKFSKKELLKFINSTAGQQVMVNLQFGDGTSKLALMKDYQVDPEKENLLHVDFFEVSLTEKVKVSVHVSIIGEPIGVKRDGGILQHLLREIEVECLPDRIPSHIKLDISNLEIGQSLHVGDIKLEEGIRVLTDPDEVIVNIIAPTVEEVAAPAEAVAAPEITEPEVIKKGKKEEEEEEK
ncbi:MAG: 50S ribosomal protein L25 [Nitrospirae bacterium]|nr:50S ribosomal protein L25 [Nitrospirota bacterium]